MKLFFFGQFSLIFLRFVLNLVTVSRIIAKFFTDVSIKSPLYLALMIFFFHLRPVPRVEPIASEDNIGGEDDDEVIGMTNRMTLEDDKELRSVSSNLGRIPSFNNTPSNNNHVHITTSPISSSFAEVSLPTFDTRSGY